MIPIYRVIDDRSPKMCYDGPRSRMTVASQTGLCLIPASAEAEHEVEMTPIVERRPETQLSITPSTTIWPTILPAATWRPNSSALGGIPNFNISSSLR